MPMRKPTMQNYQRKKQRQVKKEIASSSKSKLRGYSFDKVSDIERGKKSSLGQAVASGIRGTVQRKRMILAEADKGIRNIFSTGRNTLLPFLNSLPKKERQLMTKYISARIARVVALKVKKKLGKIPRKSEKFALSSQQQKFYSLYYQEFQEQINQLY